MKINDNGGGRQNGLVDFGTTFCLKEEYKRKVQRYILTKRGQNSTDNARIQPYL